MWTVLSFLVLVAVLTKFAWKPLLAAIDAREESIQNNIRSAEKSKAEAERLRKDYEGHLAQMEAKAREILSQAESESRRLKEDMARSAQAENEKLMAQTRQKMAEEERRLLRDLRGEVAQLALQAAEKMLRQGLDKSAQDRLLKAAVSDLEQSGAGR